MGAHRVSLGRVWSTACTLIVPGSHEGLFYRVYVMTGEYTEPCLIRNPSEARIMLSYLHDCQGTVKNTVRGIGAVTSCCSDSGSSRQLLSNPCCGLALVYLMEGTSGTQILLFNYLFCFKRIHVLVGNEAEFAISCCCPMHITVGPAETLLGQILRE